MSAEANRNAITTAVEAWNAGDGVRYLDLYDPSITHHGLGPEPFDRRANRDFYEATWAAFPGAQLTVDDIVTDGDKLAARFHLAGTHQGEFMGIAATGRSGVLNGNTIMMFRDGRVVERWTTVDLLGLLIQLGALDLPAG
jgi:predicted ester cyclase